ncbi:MAG: retropepsin-like aspartic protease [Cyanobacteria bacterium J06638_22]
MANARAPKQWSLTKNETVTSFESWRQNLIYTLALDNKFSPYLAKECTWLKASADPKRGFKDDENDVVNRQTADQKCTMLELMLGQIANYCPIIARNAITKKSTSLDGIWQTIRAHFGFQSTGAHFLDLGDIKLETDERYEDLFQRLSAFFEDNLVTKDSALTHCGEVITGDEEMTPTVDNIIVFMWLTLIHKDLPKLVKQKYGTELRSRTVASIKPEISQALESLIDELNSTSDVRAMRSVTSNDFKSTRPKNRSLPTSGSRPRNNFKPKSCPLCKAASRPDTHFLSECIYLPEADRRFMSKARLIAQVLDDDAPPTDEGDEPPVEPLRPEPIVRRVQVRQSPYLDTYFGHKTPRIVIDSGATANLISETAVQWLQVPVTTSSQSAGQADGLSQLNVIGETKFDVTRDHHKLTFHALVVKHLDVPFLAGTPFMEANDVYARPSTRQIYVGKSVYRYGSPNSSDSSAPVARRASVLRCPNNTTIWPGDYIELPIPEDYSNSDETFALEPRLDCPGIESVPSSQTWPSPSLVSSISGTIRIPNNSDTPKTLRRNDHFCQIRPVFSPSQSLSSTPPPNTRAKSQHSLVTVDPDGILPPSYVDAFNDISAQYSEVFDAQLGKYNGAYGPFEAVVNMGPVQPPQRKGRLPHYNHDRLTELQAKFDELENLGVIVKPETTGTPVEYVNPSFLIKKPSGGSRLVTAFAEVGQYRK